MKCGQIVYNAAYVNLCYALMDRHNTPKKNNIEPHTHTCTQQIVLIFHAKCTQIMFYDAIQFIIVYALRSGKAFAHFINIRQFTHPTITSPMLMITANNSVIHFRAV